MNSSGASQTIAIIFAGGYTLLLFASYIRQTRHRNQARWLHLFLFLAVIWEFIYFFSPSIIYPPNLPIIFLAISTMVLGLATAAFADWSSIGRWLIAASSIVVAIILVNILIPGYALVFPQSNIPPINDGYLVASLIKNGKTKTFKIRIDSTSPVSSMIRHSDVTANS